ncbi:LOW QUALITY PROTEIN: solute carrier family 35 member F6 [Eudromia elegans]
MSWSRYQLGLAALMLLMGSSNTLAAKPGCGAWEVAALRQPLSLQATGMFPGEFSCLGVFYPLLRRSSTAWSPARPFNPLLFLPPALCNVTRTSITYVGDPEQTGASSFQVLRGSGVLTSLLSAASLGRRLRRSQCLGIPVTIVGLPVAGLADRHGTREGKQPLRQLVTEPPVRGRGPSAWRDRGAGSDARPIPWE